MAEVLGVAEDAFTAAWRGCLRERETGVIYSTEEGIEHTLSLMGREAVPANVSAAAQIRIDAVRAALEPRPGVLDMLDELRDGGHRLGLINNCSGDVPLVWPETPFRDRFGEVTFSASVGVMKPEPEIYDAACEQLGVEAEACLYIGNGESHELDGAAQAGLSPWLLLIPEDDPPASAEHRTHVDAWRHRLLRSPGEVLGLVRDRQT